MRLRIASLLMFIWAAVQNLNGFICQASINFRVLTFWCNYVGIGGS